MYEKKQIEKEEKHHILYVSIKYICASIKKRNERKKGRETSSHSVCVNKIYNTYFKCASIKKRNERKKGRETSSHSVCVSKNYNNINKSLF
jgi:hypothetical protein